MSTNTKEISESLGTTDFFDEKGIEDVINKRQEGVWIQNDEKKSKFEPDETLRQTFGDLTYRFGILYPTEKNPYTTLMYGEDVEKVPYRNSLDIKGNADVAEQLVTNTIKHFYDRKDISLFHINNYISSRNMEINHEQENVWIKNYEKLSSSHPNEMLRHTFGNTTIKFEIEYHPENLPETVLICKEEFGNNKAVFDIKANTDTVRQLVNNTIQYFDQKQDVSMLNIKSNLSLQIMNIHQEEDLRNPQDLYVQLAKKAGYVQGVCECVTAIGDDHTLGKKLLTEMNVTKDMAKKFANPETYKALEQGIFAPQQKIEQTHSIKR